MHIGFFRKISLHKETRILLCSFLLSLILRAKLEAPRGFKGDSWERLPGPAGELEGPVPARGSRLVGSKALMMLCKSSRSRARFLSLVIHSTNPSRLPYPTLSAGVALEDESWAALREVVLIQD